MGHLFNAVVRANSNGLRYTLGMLAWHPVHEPERYQVLDLARGLALFGVLLVNLLYFFRISLFAEMTGTPEYGTLNALIDTAVHRLIEFKAFDMFSISFGIGVAIQADRAHQRGVNAAAFLARRFLVLLAFGAAHMTFISNVDILCLYSICGLALIPALRLRCPVLLAIGVAAVMAQSYIPLPPFPHEASLRAHAAEATRVYTHSGFATITAFRWRETVRLIFPLLVSVSVKTYGLMLGGMALWRAGVIRERERHRWAIWCACAVSVVAWALTREHIPLALAYFAALLGWRQSKTAQRWNAPFAAAGRMAFTNYLTQSVVFAAVFYGCGLMGRVEIAPAAASGVLFYAAQVWFSAWWLRRHSFGPFEWIWRSLTYGRRV